MATKKGLGKGLDSLIADKVSTKPTAKSLSQAKPSSEHAADAVMMDITKVEPNRDQPRKKFDEDALLELGESIKQFGVLQPLLVQERDDYYEIIAGERRWRAAKLAGVKEVPVIIKKLTEQEIMEQSPTIWEYLHSGIEKTSQKYLCKNRKKWYWQEHRDTTYFLCSYMGRRKYNESPIRFILNLSEAIVTNSYLMLYPKEHLQKAISDNPKSIYRIWELLKSINGSDIEEEGRVYGGGLKKIEPRELAKVPCGDLMKLCFA